MGPLHLAYQRQEIEEQVEDARSRGAVSARRRAPEGEAFDERQLLSAHADRGCAVGLEVVREEVFGPVLPVFRFTDLDEAIEKANDSIYGLGVRSGRGT